MDLESESVDDNQVNPERVSHADADDNDDNEIRNNASCANVTENVVDTRVNHVDTARPVNLTVPATQSSGGGSPPTAKGAGLRKWKRMKRIIAKNDSDNAVDDSSKVLKRGLSGNGDPVKPKNSSLDIKHNSEGSVGSVNMIRNVGVIDGFGIHGSSSDSRFAVGSVFATGADSDNSEDRSSKSSTAASVPKAKFELPALDGHGWEKSRMKSTSGKNFSSSVQRSQQGRARIESGKKHRGDRVKIEAENSYSSLESDSRSSNFVFMRSPTPTSNGKYSGRSMSPDEENSDEVHASEQQFSEEGQTGFCKQNVEGVEDFCQDNFPAATPLKDQDPLVESILNLQSVEEALAKELKKFTEIGKEPLLPADLSSSDLGISESNLSEYLDSEKIGLASLKSSEAQVLSLKQNVKLLESKLDETRAMLEVKESRVSKLEDMINISKSGKEESGSTIGLEEETCRELETELEGLFRQMIEAQVEYIAIKRTTQRMKFAAGGQIELLNEQEAVAGEQTQMLNKLGEVEIRAAKLKERAEELGKYSGDIIATEEVFTMPNRIFKISSCLVVQLISLGLTIWFSFSQSPHQEVTIPT